MHQAKQKNTSFVSVANTSKKKKQLETKRLSTSGGSSGSLALNKIRAQFQELVERLAKFSGLNIDLVKNIAIYAKSLTAESNKVIDEKVFIAQMAQTFGIEDKHMVGQLFHITRSERRSFITVDEYCRIICIFVSGNFELQGPLVFRVYDQNNDGVIDRRELNLLLQPCVMSMTEETDEESSGAISNELLDLVNLTLSILDLDENGHIDIDEFTIKVEKDPLLLECLGQCLPTGTHLEEFLSRISDKKPSVVAKMFEHERRRCLSEPLPIRNKKALYPFELEMF